MINPGLQLYAFDQPGVMRRELRYAKSIQPRSDGNGLFPVREPPPVSQIGFFLQQPVSYNLIPNWRSDDKLARSFVIGMIDHPYDKATSEFIVTAPIRYQVVANGLLQEETDLGDGRRLTHWK